LTLLEGIGLVVVGMIASGINSVAGGGSLLSFPYLTEIMRIPSLPANATNSVALWPGSLSGAFGFINLLGKTKHHLLRLLVPTIVGSALGALLLTRTSQRVFDAVVPFLILLAAFLLLLQPRVKAWVQRGERTMPVWGGVVLQLLVALYGGYFGAGMGIMMLASFALYMDGTIHELNAVKNWLGVAINVVASVHFFASGLVLVPPALLMGFGSIIGGFAAARVSQRLNPDKLRMAIAIYGIGMAGWYAYKTFMG